MILEGCVLWLPNTRKCFFPLKELFATLKTRWNFENALYFLDAFIHQEYIWSDLWLENGLLKPHFYGDKNDYYFGNSAKGETVSCFQVSVEPYF